MAFSFKKFTVIFAFFLVHAAISSPITTSGLESSGRISRQAQLEEFGDILTPGAMAYISFGFYWFPFPRQTALRSIYGKHDGYAFKQRLGAYFSAPLNELNPDISLGFLWFLEREGFDSEDFILWPNYGTFSFVKSVQTAGVSITSIKKILGIAGGIQYENPEFESKKLYLHESDSLYSWGNVFVGPMALQGTFNGSKLNTARASLHLEAKELNGNVYSTYKTYLPNFDVTFYNYKKDSVKVRYEQNLYGQILYAEAEAFFIRHGFYAASLKYYPDPSRIASFDFTCFKDSEGNLNFGGGFHIFMVRMAFNHAYDYEHLFGTKRSFVMEINFALGAKDGNFFGKKAAKPAPTTSVTTSGRNKQNSSSTATESVNEDGVKEITAKGVRRNKK